MIKRLNWDAFIWTSILILIFYCFVRMLYTGDIRNYIHPDMIKYTVFGTVAILLMLLSSLGQIFKESSFGNVKYGYLLFLIPVLVYLFFRPSGLSESAAVNRGVNIMFYKTADREEHNHNHVHEHGDGKMTIQGNKIIISNNNLFTSVKEIYGNVPKYKDYSIEMEGFVMLEKGNNSGFILSRMVVSCCAADTEVIGIKCSYNDTVQGGKWVRVTGRVEQAAKASVPSIVVNSVKYIDKPEDSYIYRD